MMKNITTLVFDLGGVIHNLDNVLLVRSLADLGFDPEANFEKHPLLPVLIEYINGPLSEDDMCDMFRPYLNRETTNGQIVEALLTQLVEIPVNRLQTLKRLRDRFRIYLLSNINERYWNRSVEIMKSLGYSPEDCFDGLFLSYEMNTFKPNASIYQALTGRTGLVPSETLYFDDLIPNVMAGTQAGFVSVPVKMNHLEDTSEWQELENM